eukprot:TRINITY_DN2030_c0_g1::TRINITY_DN2030_c0_g1_i1::g.21797::m.21797 TRINITY_DN2030_c0_g1::TRINITY_DN2030_c0_g1_i1::g.21797  ORF type:complete len:119 (-),score=27.43 TRINITY_DN2030_c0_g1_i1:96-419(-)
MAGGFAGLDHRTLSYSQRLMKLGSSLQFRIVMGSLLISHLGVMYATSPKSEKDFAKAVQHNENPYYFTPETYIKYAPEKLEAVYPEVASKLRRKEISSLQTKVATSS